MDNKARKDRFKILFEEYYSMLCNIAYQYIPDTDECEDIVQEAFISIWNRGKDELPPQEFGAYIVTSVKNKCISSLRQRKLDVIPMDAINSLPGFVETEEHPGDESPDPDEILANALAILPPKCRIVFNMSKLKGMKYREIAQELNVSEKTVENQMGKAMKLLRAYAIANPVLISILIILIILCKY